MKSLSLYRLASIFGLALLTASCAHDEHTLPGADILSHSGAVTRDDSAPTPPVVGCGVGFEGSGADVAFVEGKRTPYGERAKPADKADLRLTSKPRKRPEPPAKPAWLDGFHAEYKKQSEALAVRYGTDKAGFEKARAKVKKDLFEAMRK